jgi:CheY-like chemotaxis protein
MDAASQPETYFEWIVHQTRGQLLDLVLEVEDRLRRLIRSVFIEHQSDWVALIPDSVRQKLETMPSSTASHDLLDRASLGQLIDLAMTQWSLLAQFLGDKHAFRVKANVFREWRNSLAHGKEPSDDEKVEIAVAIRQVGQQIPVVEAPGSTHVGHAVFGSSVLWADDHPEWSLEERAILRTLGINVVPVVSNEEAVSVANERPFDLVISDINRDGDENGLRLPERLRTIGINLPFLFYTGEVDLSLGVPAGAVGISDDPALLIRDVLNVLSDRGSS